MSVGPSDLKYALESPTDRALARARYQRRGRRRIFHSLGRKKVVSRIDRGAISTINCKLTEVFAYFARVFEPAPEEPKPFGFNFKIPEEIPT
jgi:hypothetical protein